MNIVYHYEESTIRKKKSVIRKRLQTFLLFCSITNNKRTMSKEKLYQIEELPDLKVDWTNAFEYQDVPLLDYVWEVANHFLPNFVETDNGFMPSESIAPAIFCNRYFERNLTAKERYEREMEMGRGTHISFERYLELHASINSVYRRLNDSFKERFLTNEDLQNTIEAYKLDVSKFWYLLLFVYDFIEDIGVNTPELKQTNREDFNNFFNNLSEATSIILKKNNRKSYMVDEKETIEIIRIAIRHFVNTYNNIIHNEQDYETMSRKLKDIGLDNVRFDNIPKKFFLATRDCLDISYKKWKFTEMLMFFIKSRKATAIPNKKVKVSKDKWMFVSRLIYTVGYDGKRYNEEYDSEGNKNRMLSNLLRRYKNEEFPSYVAINYMVNL